MLLLIDEPQGRSSQGTFSSDTGEARASLRLLGLGREKVRGRGRLSSSPFANLHGITVENNLGPSSVGIRHVLRGDTPITDHSVRIFRWSEGARESGSSSLCVPGLDPLALEKDADGYYNRPLPRVFEPLTIVKALTVDGHGGTLDLTLPFPRLCFWYYVENDFICSPDYIELGYIKVRKPSGFDYSLEDTPFRVQRENLAHWLSQVYRTDCANAPTHRPVTENYYSQIKKSDRLDPEKKENLGLQVFGAEIYEILEARKHDILNAVQQRQRK